MDTSPAKAGTAPGPDRRAGPRYSANPETSCRVTATDDLESQPAEIDNISASGIKVILHRSYEVGTFLVVRLTTMNGSLERILMTRVIRVAPEAAGKYSLGCAFLTPLQGHELFTLVL